MVALAHPILLGGAERREWLAARKKHVTATDVYTIFGYGYDGQTVADVARDKRTDEIEDRTEIPDRLRAGLELEPCCAARFMESTGIQIIPSRGLTVSAENPLFAASLDYVPADGSKGVTELKTLFSAPGDEWGQSGSDYIPEKFLIQTTWQAGVIGADHATLGAWWAGYQFRHFKIPFMAPFFKLLADGATEFKALLDSGFEFPADWKPGVGRRVDEAAALYLEEREHKLPPEADALIEEYADLGKSIKLMDERRDVIKAELIPLCKDASHSFAPGGGKVTRYHVAGGWTEPYYRKPRIDSRITAPKRKAL